MEKHAKFLGICILIGATLTSGSILIYSIRYRYKIQDGLVIDKFTGQYEKVVEPHKEDYQLVGIYGTYMYHKDICEFVKKTDIKQLVFFSSLKDTAEKGYNPCSSCNPIDNYNIAVDMYNKLMNERKSEINNPKEGEGEDIDWDNVIHISESSRYEETIRLLEKIINRWDF